MSATTGRPPAGVTSTAPLRAGSAQTPGASTAMPQPDTAPAMEQWLRHQLRGYAAEVHTLAYTFPHGMAEHALLQLAEQMTACAMQSSVARSEGNTLVRGGGSA